MAKIECEQCSEKGYLGQLEYYFRVRHYAGIDPNTAKSKFTYPQQSDEYAVSQIASNRKGESLTIKQPIIEHLTSVKSQISKIWALIRAVVV